jgi:hypothetical protein
MTIGRTGALAWRPAAFHPYWRISALAVLGGCLILTIIVIGTRRLMGALSDPLPPAVLLATVALAALATVAMRWLWLPEQPDRSAIRWIPPVLLLLLAAALCLPGTSSWAIAGVCAVLAGNVALQRGMHPLRLVPGRGPLHDHLSPEITQKFTRRRTSEGAEMVEGVFRAVLAAGQRIEHCHVAFCPAFPSSPRVTCRQLEGPAARVKVAQVLPQGMRVELRLEETPSESATVLLEVVAESGADA